jgi:hypothetical protein
MTLYSFKGARPTSLPNRIKLSNGFTKTDNTTFTAEDLSDAGWIPVDNPPTVNYPNKLEWNGSTLEWYSRSPNDAETQFKWQEIRKECERKLAETDYKVIKAVETGIPLDPVYVTYRQALRDLYNNVNNADPWAVEFPLLSFGQEPTANTEPGII